MSNEYRAKVFKSGNSVALRLPKALGIAEGTEMIVREERGRFELEPVEAPKRKFDVAALWGICPDLKLLSSEDQEFEHVPRIWDDPSWTGWPEKSDE